jgi:hypothetical protein
MTRDEIFSLVGRDLHAAVFRGVMGATCEFNNGDWWPTGEFRAKHYSVPYYDHPLHKNWWDVAERMFELGFDMDLRKTGLAFSAEFWAKTGDPSFPTVGDGADGTTPGEAICRAALASILDAGGLK